MERVEKAGGAVACESCALPNPVREKPKRPGMSKRQKRWLARIGAAMLVYFAAILLSSEGLWSGGGLLPLQGIPKAVAFLAAYAIIGWDIIWRALKNIVRGQVFDENFLMCVATVGAIVLGEYSEGVAVMLFYQVGEWFQSYAVGRSRSSIAALMDIRPDHANLQMADGTLQEVDPEAVEVGAVIVVKPGERVPLDGIVEEGASALDTAALTGESMPRQVAAGDEVISGCINLSGVLMVKVEKPYGESTVARILELVENSGSKKAKTEQFITRFARWYTPIVCFAALALALVPPLVTGQAFGVWVYRALTFLVISCPCALVISVPLSFFGGIGGASKAGVLVKGGNYLEALAKAETVVFDKTGTLTEGRFAVTGIHPTGMTEEELLRLAAGAESYSDHPIALSIRAAYGEKTLAASLGEAAEVAGQGVRVQLDGSEVLAGNDRLMRENGIEPDLVLEAGTVVHVAAGGRYAGWLMVEDVVKPDARLAVEKLHGLGVKKTVMLTGDADDVGRKVAAEIGLDEVHTRLLPQNKVEKVEALLEDPARKGSLVFVGDGVNDAPVLARADVGVAMGALGSDAAIEAADVVIMTDEPSKLATAIGISRRTGAIVRQNIVFALGVKAVVLVLGALGFASMWAAVFADVGVSVLAILNAMRALKVKVDV